MLNIKFKKIFHRGRKCSCQASEKLLKLLWSMQSENLTGYNFFKTNILKWHLIWEKQCWPSMMCSLALFSLTARMRVQVFCWALIRPLKSLKRDGNEKIFGYSLKHLQLHASMLDWDPEHAWFSRATTTTNMLVVNNYQCDKIVRFFVYKVSQILNEILGNFKKQQMGYFWKIWATFYCFLSHWVWFKISMNQIIYVHDLVLEHVSVKYCTKYRGTKCWQ